MRELKKSDSNVLILVDPMGGGKVKLLYRTPTTEERIEFVRSQSKREGNRIVSKVPEARLASGLAILTGIGEGDFGYDGVAISSDPTKPGYREDWKELIEETAADLIMVLGQQIFEGDPLAGMTLTFADGEPKAPVAAGGKAPAKEKDEEKEEGGEKIPLTS